MPFAFSFAGIHEETARVAQGGWKNRLAPAIMAKSKEAIQ